MATVYLDPQGRLTGLAVDPPQREDESATTGPVKATDWSLLFSEAQIDLSKFTATQPRWTPDNYCDERAAWEGFFPGQSDIPIRIEAGAVQGIPTFLHIIGPWTKPWRMEVWPETMGQKIASAIFLSILLALVVAGILLAHRNLKLRRSDRAGAGRLAFVCLLLMVACWLLVVDHVADFWGEFDRLRVLVGKALVAVGIMWLWYIALEPYVRRRWPHALISWSRILAGRIRDPLVGRDLLVGGVAAVGMTALDGVRIWVNSLLGQPPSAPGSGNWLYLLGLRFQIGGAFDPSYVFFALLILFLFLGLRLLLRREWLAVVAVLVLAAVLDTASAPSNSPPASTFVNVITGTIWWSIALLVTVRFGLLAIAFLMFFQSLVTTPASWGLTGWQSGPSWTAIIIVTAIVAYGFHTALGGRSLFRDDLLDA